MCSVERRGVGACELFGSFLLGEVNYILLGHGEKGESDLRLPLWMSVMFGEDAGNIESDV